MRRNLFANSVIATRLAAFLTLLAIMAPLMAKAADKKSFNNWEEVVEAARGGTVNWFMWGGADNINEYVSGYIGSELKDRYNVTLKRVGINDTAEAVNIVIGEKQAGIDDAGARTENPPKSIAELIDWVKESPGEFTYPAATDFNGSVFVRHVFYHAAGGPEALLGDFDQEKFDTIAPKAWAILNEMEPYLWREGETYPNAIASLAQLFANREVALYFDYDPAIFGINVENGIFPETTRSYGLQDGTIGNTNYVAIPYNSPNKAAAMVAANYLLSFDTQYEKAKSNVWGAAPAIDVTKLDDDAAARFAALPRHPAVVAPEVLARKSLPELHPDWISAIEKGWQENVGN